jgi:hypothetical protein
LILFISNCIKNSIVEKKFLIFGCKFRIVDIEKNEKGMDEKWNGKYYKTKEVKPVFVDEENEIVVITVYTYYS